MICVPLPLHIYTFVTMWAYGVCMIYGSLEIQFISVTSLPCISVYWLIAHITSVVSVDGKKVIQL